MLKMRYLFGNFDLAKEALKHWAHEPDDLDDRLKGFRISSNAIYPFTHQGSVCYLRLAPIEEKLKDNLIGELEFIQYLRTHGYPALEPLPAKTGELLVELDTSWGAYYASAFHGVPGKPLDQTEMTEDISYLYGKSLGRMHALSAQYAPEHPKWNHEDGLLWISNMLKEYRAPDIAVEELKRVCEELSSLPIRQDNYGLVHYDFELDNVFYDPVSKSLAAIDFDDGMYHWFALDLEQAFDSMRDEMPENLFDDAKASFMRGYQTEYAFTQESAGLLPAMRRYINLYKYARLIRCIDEEFQDEPDWMSWLRTKLASVIEQLETNWKEMK